MKRNDYNHKNDWTVQRINRNIKYLCESNGISMEELAYKIKIKPERLDFAQKHMETNVLNDEQVKNICKAFSLRYKDLLEKELYK